MFGPNKDKSAHGVVRFGGHIEKNETPVGCIIREAAEEASVSIKLFNSPHTFYMENQNRMPKRMNRMSSLRFSQFCSPEE
jgi:8-oxo-dGTP pyrophosphatase MutT (NUDIX family)